MVRYVYWQLTTFSECTAQSGRCVLCTSQRCSDVWQQTGQVRTVSALQQSSLLNVNAELIGVGVIYGPTSRGKD